ncbi:hypothetical protein P171DRAFT_447877 [Karstenula rhodostoma CBS 690.94]|uniref:Uncharacterized protein n=1 Tax=Karstenula rhodostoma CBS 690.94 TaxID=1392251 RepID=A0A9P4P9T7_9PLEO|nr:hypothetical protein P171DRAFT_447877 [Karstenula rhodostoma CBS 690.94]
MFMPDAGRWAESEWRVCLPSHLEVLSERNRGGDSKSLFMTAPSRKNIRTPRHLRLQIRTNNTMQPYQYRNIAPKPPASSPAPPTARAETSAAPPPPPPAMSSLALSQNVAPARSAPSNPLALRDLDTVWVDKTLLPFLHYACIDLGLSASQLKDYALAAMLWAYLHPTAPAPAAADEDLLFERIFLSVMNRHNSTDTEIAPYTTRLTPLVRYLVRRAMTKGPYKLLDREWTGSEEWVAEMKERYGCKCEECRGGKTEMRSTAEMLGRELLE